MTQIREGWLVRSAEDDGIYIPKILVRRFFCARESWHVAQYFLRPLAKQARCSEQCAECLVKENHKTRLKDWQMPGPIEANYLKGKFEPNYPVPALVNARTSVVLDWYRNEDGFWTDADLRETWLWLMSHVFR